MRPTLTHAGVYVRDIDRMIDFYTRVLDLRVSDCGHGTSVQRELVFLSNDPDEHHQLVLVTGRPDDAPSTVQQLAFEVDALADVRAGRRRAVDAGATDVKCLSHGNAWSVYFADPEGNTIEIYTDTPWHVPQPFANPLDLDESDDVIYAQTEAECRATPGFLPREEWAATRRASSSST